MGAQQHGGFGRDGVISFSSCWAVFCAPAACGNQSWVATAPSLFWLSLPRGSRSANVRASLLQEPDDPRNAWFLFFVRLLLVGGIAAVIFVQQLGGIWGDVALSGIARYFEFVAASVFLWRGESGTGGGAA